MVGTRTRDSAGSSLRKRLATSRRSSRSGDSPSGRGGGGYGVDKRGADALPRELSRYIVKISRKLEL
jgi:hypothetical protein